MGWGGVAGWVVESRREGEERAERAGLRRRAEVREVVRGRGPDLGREVPPRPPTTPLHHTPTN